MPERDDAKLALAGRAEKQSCSTADEIIGTQDVFILLFSSAVFIRCCTSTKKTQALDHIPHGLW
jgi:hypothetical protein